MSSIQYTNLTRSAFTVTKNCSTDILSQLGVEGDSVKSVCFEVYSNVTDPTVDVVFRVNRSIKTQKEIIGLSRDSDLLSFITQGDE